MENKVKDIVQGIINKNKITSPPIPIIDIVNSFNIAIQEENFEDEISGFLYRSKENATIVLNKKHPRVRRNFTLAHELGHYCLNHSGELFVDNVFFRDSNSKTGLNKYEIEANKFAAELLMPKDMVIDSIKSINYKIEDKNKLDRVVKKFNVSREAFLIRLGNLGF